MSYEPVIGLEVHAQLMTDSKVFCRCRTKFGAEQNSQVCPICLGMPGVLPVLNKQAVEFTIRIGLATQCQIAPYSVFARKNYFYPDLPKGYQISQYEEPLCRDGKVSLEFGGGAKQIHITRIHLEEDAGKSVHAEDYVDENETLVDVNRCGVPLVEIVTEPDIRSPREAAAYLTSLRQIVQYLEICDGNMEEGSLRCDANVSVRPIGSEGFGVKTELKNMNSFKSVERALQYEIERQIELLESEQDVTPQTLLWDTDRNEAVPMRTKEFAHDYRYFPEPDLVPLEIGSEWIAKIKESLPELPQERKGRMVEQYGLPGYDAGVLTDNRALADYFEEVAKCSGHPKLASNWVMGEVLRTLKEQQIEVTEFDVSPASLADLIKLINEGTISGKIAKSVFAEMVAAGKQPEEIVKEKGLLQISQADQIKEYVQSALKDNPTEVRKYLAGKEQLLGFLVGQVMKATGGKANPKMLTQLLLRELENLRE